MKKLFLFLIAFVCVASLAFAAEQAANTTTATTVTTTVTTQVPAVEAMTLKGDIIDNMCSDMVKPEELAGFVKTHPKTCAISAAGAASGYSILADGKLMKFDADSNAKIAEFLKKEDSKLQVVVTAEKAGELLSLVSIENQK